MITTTKNEVIPYSPRYMGILICGSKMILSLDLVVGASCSVHGCIFMSGHLDLFLVLTVMMQMRYVLNCFTFFCDSMISWLLTTEIRIVGG